MTSELINAWNNTIRPTKRSSQPKIILKMHMQCQVSTQQYVMDMDPQSELVKPNSIRQIKLLCKNTGHALICSQFVIVT